MSRVRIRGAEHRRWSEMEWSERRRTNNTEVWCKLQCYNRLTPNFGVKPDLNRADDQ